MYTFTKHIKRNMLLVIVNGVKFQYSYADKLSYLYDRGN